MAKGKSFFSKKIRNQKINPTPNFKFSDAMNHVPTTILLYNIPYNIFRVRLHLVPHCRDCRR